MTGERPVSDRLRFYLYGYGLSAGEMAFPTPSDAVIDFKHSRTLISVYNMGLFIVDASPATITPAGDRLTTSELIYAQADQNRRGSYILPLIEGYQDHAGNTPEMLQEHAWRDFDYSVENNIEILGGFSRLLIAGTAEVIEA